MRPLDPRLVELRELGARIGDDVYVGPEVYVEKDFAELLTIEDGVILSQGVTILLHDSSLNNVVGAPIRFGPVVLREGCYIGANATVMCGVEVGAGALVGACALLNGDVPAGMVAYGQPARVTGTVEEVARRQADDGSGRYFYVPAPRWRDRDGAADERLTADIRRAFDEFGTADPGRKSQ